MDNMQGLDSKKYEALRRYFLKRMKQDGITVPTEKLLDAYLVDYIAMHDNKVKANYEGYSLEEVDKLVKGAFQDSSTIKIQKLSAEDYAKIPILRQVKYFMQIIQREGGIELIGSLGHLPLHIVEELYPFGVGDYYVDSGILKLTEETDSAGVSLTKILLKIMRLIKIRSNVLTLTKEGAKMAADDELLTNALIVSFCSQLNLGYVDEFESEVIGNAGIGFTLMLVSKYGSKKRPSNFYSDKYFKAFPMFIDSPDETVTPAASICYSCRLFDCLLLNLGLVEVSKEFSKGKESKMIVKTELFDKLIKILPPRK